MKGYNLVLLIHVSLWIVFISAGLLVDDASIKGLVFFLLLLIPVGIYYLSKRIAIAVKGQSANKSERRYNRVFAFSQIIILFLMIVVFSLLTAPSHENNFDRTLNEYKKNPKILDSILTSSDTYTIYRREDIDRAIKRGKKTELILALKMLADKMSIEDTVYDARNLSFDFARVRNFPIRSDGMTYDKEVTILFSLKNSGVKFISKWNCNKVSCIEDYTTHADNAKYEVQEMKTLEDNLNKGYFPDSLK